MDIFPCFNMNLFFHSTSVQQEQQGCLPPFTLGTKLKQVFGSPCTERPLPPEGSCIFWHTKNEGTQGRGVLLGAGNPVKPKAPASSVLWG